MTWLAAVVVAAAGGWFWGRALLVSHQGPAPAPAKAQVRHTSFAPGSAEGQWMKRVKEAKKEDFPRLLDEWKDLFPEGDNYLEGRPENALRWIFAVWLVKDSEGFLKTVTAHDYEYSYWGAQVLVRLMPERAEELLLGPNCGELDDTFVGIAARELAERSPALYLKINPDGVFEQKLELHTGYENWQTAITNLAKTDVMAAAAACLGWKFENNSSAFNKALLAVAAAWKASDPPMTEWINGIADPKVRNFANHARLCAMAEKDPRAALAELYSAKLEPDNDLGYDTPSEILNQFAKANPVEALKLMKDVEGIYAKYKRDNYDEPSAEEVAEKIANPFSKMGPEIFGSGGGLTDNDVRDSVLRGIAEKLPTEPGQLLGALFQLSAKVEGSDSLWQQGIAADLIRIRSATISADDCLAMVRLWSSQTHGASDDLTYQKLALRAVRENPELTSEALPQLPVQARGSFAAQLILYASASPSATIALLGELAPAQWNYQIGERLGQQGEAYAEMIGALPAATTMEARQWFMQKWGERDPDAASRWLASLPNDAAALPTALGLMNSWSGYDIEAASAWAASLAPGPKRDGAADSLSSAIAKDQPKLAWEWANSIADPTVRSKALLDLDFKWEYDAPPEYRAALDQVRRVEGWPDRGEKPPPDPNDPFAPVNDASNSSQ